MLRTSSVTLRRGTRRRHTPEAHAGGTRRRHTLSRRGGGWKPRPLPPAANAHLPGANVFLSTVQQAAHPRRSTIDDDVSRSLEVETSEGALCQLCTLPATRKLCGCAPPAKKPKKRRPPGAAWKDAPFRPPTLTLAIKCQLKMGFALVSTRATPKTGFSKSFIQFFGSSSLVKDSKWGGEGLSITQHVTAGRSRYE